MRFLSPDTLSRTAGYSHVAVAPAGRTVYVSGRMALDRQGRLVGGSDFRAQAEQVFANLKTALEAGGASFEDVAKLDFYVTDMAGAPALREVRDRYIDAAHPPVSTLVEVRRLVREDALLEVAATAVLPDAPARSAGP
ncbi:enamine deaminase RidA [Fulvimonas soli]|nr:enamine deaminase RidA [Fulvimonas soli]